VGEQGQPCYSVYLSASTSIQLETLSLDPNQSTSYQARVSPIRQLLRDKTSRYEDGLTTMALRGQRAALTSAMAVGPVFSSHCRASLALGKLTLMGNVFSIQSILPFQPTLYCSFHCTALLVSPCSRGDLPIPK
jgi:hypothetical protein